MIFRTVLFTYFLLILSFLSFGEEKQSIAIAPFYFVKGSIEEGDLKRIEARVEKIINEMKRFQVVNRSEMVALDSERVRTMGEDFIDGRYIEQGKKLGAQIMVFGRVNSSTNKPSSKNNDSYIATINFTIKFVDVATTAELANTSIESSTGKSAAKSTAITKVSSRFLGKVTGANTSDADKLAGDVLSKTPEQALTKAIENIDDQLRPYLIDNFPASFPVSEVLDRKDNKIRSILIAGGKGAGLKSGDKLKVVEMVEMNVGDKKHIRNVPVAELTISKVDDDTFSQCEVTSGGVPLNDKIAAKANLKAITVTGKSD